MLRKTIIVTSRVKILQIRKKNINFNIMDFPDLKWYLGIAKVVFRSSGNTIFPLKYPMLEQKEADRSEGTTKRDF